MELFGTYFVSFTTKKTIGSKAVQRRDKERMRPMAGLHCLCAQNITTRMMRQTFKLLIFMAVAVLTAGCSERSDVTAGDAGLADFEQTMRVAATPSWSVSSCRRSAWAPSSPRAASMPTSPTIRRRSDRSIPRSSCLPVPK